MRWLLFFLLCCTALALPAVDLTPRQARLWPCGERTASLRDDASAPYGEVIVQPCTSGSDWAIQWNDFDFSQLDPEKEYSLEVLASMENAAREGPAFQLGIWNHAASGNVLHRVVGTDELAAGQWWWVEIGTGLMPAGNAVIYAGPVADSVVQNALIAAVRLVPADERQDALSRPMYQAGSPWRNALAPAGERQSLAMASNGSALRDIVLPAQPSPQEEYAARLLKRTLDRITGADFQLLRERGARPAVLLTTDAGCGETGYEIRLQGDDLVLAGGTRRGPVNAVVALLEEDLGCRLYARYDQMRLPQRPELSLEVVSRRYVPALRMRDPHIWEAFDADWAVWNRTNAAWASTVYVPDELGGMQGHPRELFAHTFEYLVPPDQYFAAHPEYFPLVDGQRKFHQPGVAAAQLCLTNPDTPAIAAARIRAVLAQNPTAGYVSVSQNDGSGGWCECPGCAAMLAREGSLSGPLLHFVNQVAGLLRSDYPDIRVTTLAYLESFQPPATMRPADNVVIWLATDSHIWEHPYRFIEETAKFRTAFDAWKAIGVTPLIWDYTFGDNNNWMTPVPNLAVMDHNFRYMNDRGIAGMFFQGNFQSPGTSRGALYAWVQAHMLWNPAWDFDALVADFTHGFYGPAGTAMTSYNRILHDAWSDFHAAQPVSAAFILSPGVIADLRQVLETAKEACAASPEFLPLLEREEASLLYARLNQAPAAAEKDAYGRDLTRFQALVRKFNITHFSEWGQFDEKLLSFRRFHARADRVPENVASVELPLTAARLWPCGGSTAEWRQDPGFGRIAIYQPAPESNWSVQWNNYQYPELTPGRRYQLWAEVRADGVRGAGPLLQAGWWDHRTGSHLLHREVATGEVGEGDYRWIELGEIVLPEPGEHTVFYIGPPANAAAGGYYLDSIEFIPL